MLRKIEHPPTQKEATPMQVAQHPVKELKYQGCVLSNSFHISRELSIYFGSTLVNFSITIKNIPAIAFSFIKVRVVPNQSFGTIYC